MWNTEPPVVNETYVICTALECLIGIVHAISYITENGGDREVRQNTFQFIYLLELVESVDGKFLLAYSTCITLNAFGEKQ